MSSPTTTVPNTRSTRSRAKPVNPSALIAEFLGTLALVFFGVGSVIFARQFIGVFGIALAFGFVLIALVYAIGPISGAHVNPAVTLGMVLSRRISPITAVCYWIAQFAGGLVAGALLAWVARSVPIFRVTGHGSFGSNGYDEDSALRITLGGAFLVEVILTALLVFVVLCTTHKNAVTGFDGLPIGLSLAVANLIGLPLTGAAVNPARALGPAVYASDNAMSQVWVFIVAPLVGAIVAVIIHLATHGLPGAGARQTPSGIEPSGSEGALRPHPGEPEPPNRTPGVPPNPETPPGGPLPHDPPRQHDIASSPHDMPPTAVAALRDPARRRRRRPGKATDRSVTRPGSDRRPA